MFPEEEGTIAIVLPREGGEKQKQDWRYYLYSRKGKIPFSGISTLSFLLSLEKGKKEKEGEEISIFAFYRVFPSRLLEKKIHRTSDELYLSPLFYFLVLGEGRGSGFWSYLCRSFKGLVSGRRKKERFAAFLVSRSINH